MTSVERVQEYANLEPEKDTNTTKPLAPWPNEGKLKFQQVFLRYAAEDPFVLKNVAFDINSEEKIGIVGRTGAGKTSLIQALYRLSEITGNIWIDGVDTHSIPLNILRSNISIIPQEPVLFSGTLRKNLDPFEEYEDQVILI